MLVINAANIDKDVDWMNKHIKGDVSVRNVSDEIALLALQGPKAEAILKQVADHDLAELKPFMFRDDAAVGSVQALVSRTGYTGEDGFEIYCRNEDAACIWKLLLETGKDSGLVPCGLGARDTLRFEAKLPLYGQELSKTLRRSKPASDLPSKRTKPRISSEKPSWQAKRNMERTESWLALK